MIRRVHATELCWPKTASGGQHTCTAMGLDGVAHLCAWLFDAGLAAPLRSFPGYVP